LYHKRTVSGLDTLSYEGAIISHIIFQRRKNADDKGCARSASLLLSLVFFLSVAVFATQISRAQTAAAQIKSDVAKANPLDAPGLDEKVEALLHKMTLEEKIGQLVQYSAGQATGPTSGRTDDRDMVRKGQVGSLFNVTGAQETNALQRIAVENSRLHIPLIFGLDVIHG